MAELPLLPPHWRNALRLFIATVDAIAAAGGVAGGVTGDAPAEGSAEPTARKPPTPEFKAGKDL